MTLKWNIVLKHIKSVYCLAEIFVLQHVYEDSASVISHVHDPCYAPIYHFFNYLFCLYHAIFYYAGDDTPISPPRINKVSVYPGSRLSVTVRSCQPRSTLSFRSTWTSPFWWRATSLTCASTSLSLPATHFAFFSTMMAWFAWAQRSTMHPVRPTWWVWIIMVIAFICVAVFITVLHRGCTYLPLYLYHGGKCWTVVCFLCLNALVEIGKKGIYVLSPLCMELCCRMTWTQIVNLIKCFQIQNESIRGRSLRMSMF